MTAATDHRAVEAGAPRASRAVPEPFAASREPVPPGRTWTITTASGLTLTGYLPGWAGDDPSETGVPVDQLSLRLADLSHHSDFAGQPLRVCTALGEGGYRDHEFEAFRGSITCNPYDDDAALRLPVVNIEVLPEYMIDGLTPDGITGLAAALRAQADRLDHEIRPTLIAARSDWAQHHTA
ncbi:DUF6907 domain-containing protein [Streptomyces polygonati]|uniref:DUF6907 domain-containing protein n=1 Tax=Streptomyces polygonati TaxID=1617087 RepID=A0ABV8HQV5_9ACTN